MKPLEISLPDDVRNQLEEALSHVEPIPFDVLTNDDRHTPSQKSVKEAKEIIGNILYQSPCSDELFAVQQAIIAMQTGVGKPAVMLRNLPRQQADLFVAGLFHFFDGNELFQFNEPISPGENEGFHQDSMFTFSGKKYLRGLLCVNPGSEPSPTIFTTADETLHALICRRLGIDVESDPATLEDNESYQTTMRGVVDQLHHTYALDRSNRRYKVLKRNPNHTESNGAPCWIYLEADRFGIKPGTAETIALLDEMNEARESLRAKAIEQSTASREENTLILWNDPLVHHDRAGIAKNGRLIETYFAWPAHAGRPTSRNFAIGNPASTIDLSGNREWQKAIKSQGFQTSV